MERIKSIEDLKVVAEQQSDSLKLLVKEDDPEGFVVVKVAMATCSLAAGAKEIYDLIKDFKYIVPQGSPMAGIGNKFQYVSLSNCFVIGNDVDCDSYGGVLKLDQELVQLMKRRAGVGIDFCPPDAEILKAPAAIPAHKKHAAFLFRCDAA